MKEVCPCCGGRVRVKDRRLFPRDAMARLEALAEAYPLRMGRILDIIEQIPPEGMEDLLRMAEDILSR